MAINIIVHGVTTGFDTNERDFPPFLQRFYSMPNGENYFLAEILSDKAGVKSCYTLYVSRNVSNYDGRKGSYLGVSVIIDGMACLDVKALYNALLSTFSNALVGQVIDKQGDGYRFKVGDFAAATNVVNSAVENLFSQIKNTLGSSLVPIDSSYHLNTGKVTDWNPVDLTDGEINEIVKRDGGIKLSNDLPQQAQKRLIEEERRKRQQEAEAARLEMERQKALAEKRMAEERGRAARQVKQLTDEVKATADRLTRENEAKVRGVEQQFRAQIADLQKQVAKKDDVIRSHNDEYMKLVNAIEQLNKRVADQQAAGYQAYGADIKRLADAFNSLSGRVSVLEASGVNNVNAGSGREAEKPLDPTPTPISILNPTPRQRSDRHDNSNKKLYMILAGVVVIILIALIVIFSRGESAATPDAGADTEKTEQQGSRQKRAGQINVEELLSAEQKYEREDDAMDFLQDMSQFPLPADILSSIKIAISDKLYRGDRKISLGNRQYAQPVQEALNNLDCYVTVCYPDGTIVYSGTIRGREFECDFKPEGLMNHSGGGSYDDYQVSMTYYFGTFERKNKSTRFIPAEGM